MSPIPSSPVLVIAYRRPEKVFRVLEAICSQGPRTIYLFCDGPSTNADGKAQREIARIAAGLRPEFSVITRFETSHLGLRSAVTASLDWFFSLENAGIILEDDIVPSAEFFVFCDGALDHYRHDNRIQQVSGSNIFGTLLRSSGRHFLSTRMEGWGWATWADRWHDFRSCEELPEALTFNPLFSYGLAEEILKGHRRAQLGELDTWDYTWAWYALTKKRLCLVSKVNLTKNIGFDNSATHTRRGNPIRTGDLGRPTRYPTVVTPDLLYDYAAHLYRRSKIMGFRLNKKLEKNERWLGHVWQRFLSLKLRGSRS